MDGTIFLYPVGTRVKLRDGIDPSCYDGMAKVGNEGWVRGHRRDKFGLPEIFIHWDPNHWAFNRQPDQWTFQEHFDVVEERTVSDQNRADAARQLAAEFADRMAGIFSGESAPQLIEPVEVESPTDSKEVRFAQSLEEATQAMVDSEAFICIAVTRLEDERAAHGALAVNVVGDSLSPESEVFLGSQLSTYGAQFHRNAAALHVQQFAMEREKAERGADGGAPA